MIVRNVNDNAVMETTYRAHGGAIAQMILDRRILKEIGFLAIATLAPGKEIEAHVDPMEEIYFVLSGCLLFRCRGCLSGVGENWVGFSSGCVAFPCVYSSGLLKFY